MMRVNLKLWCAVDLAEYLGTAPSWVYSHKDQIPHVKLGKYLRFDPESEAFKRWLESLSPNKYDSAALSKKDGSSPEENMTRQSFQAGWVRWKKNKQGRYAVLCYRLRKGEQKTETLFNDKGELCRSSKDADKARIARMIEINHLNNLSRRPQLMSVADFASGLWAKYTEKIKPSTASGYGSMLDRYVNREWGHRQIDSITPQDVTLFFEFREREKLSDKYRLNLYGLLNVFFEVALEYELIEANPVRRKLHRPQIERTEKPVLTAEEIKKVIEAAGENYRPLLLCVAMTGLRLGELLALRWLNVDFEQSRMTITHSLWRGRLVAPKTAGSRRVLHLPAVLIAVLKGHRTRQAGQPEDFLFTNELGGPCDPDNLRKRVLYPALEAAGIARGDRTHGFHLFRHSAATIVADRTRDIALAGELLGHSQERTTRGYAHVENVAKKATELLASEIAGESSLIESKGVN